MAVSATAGKLMIERKFIHSKTEPRISPFKIKGLYSAQNDVGTINAE